MNEISSPNTGDLREIEKIANSGADYPVLMLNLNRYTRQADYPAGTLYKSYMQALHTLLTQVGGKLLWQLPVHGQPIGAQPIHEILAAWYPTHAAFLALSTQPASKENFRLRKRAVETAVIHRCPGTTLPT